MTTIRKCQKQWTCRDGAKVRICDMSDQHLINTIRLLQRLHQAELAAMYAFSGTLTGEQATYHAEAMIDQMEHEDCAHPLYEDMVQDAERRGLTL